MVLPATEPDSFPSVEKRPILSTTNTTSFIAVYTESIKVKKAASVLVERIERPGPGRSRVSHSD
jgi:hypothetical protein